MKMRNMYLTICLAMVLTTFLSSRASLSRQVSLRGGGDETSVRGVVTTGDKLADGCYHVFLDVGANIGVHGRFLYEPDQYPDAQRSGVLFDQEFGTPRDNRDFCVFVFEPNPSHHAKIQAKADAYQAMGWRYHLIPVGVSDQDSVLNFYRQGDEKKSEWGFNAMQAVEGSDAVKVEIPVIKFSQWLSDHVHGRRLPQHVYGDYQRVVDKDGNVGAPKVMMKMDIEGMEYRVLPDLLYSGVLCRDIDFSFGEFHKKKWLFPMELDSDVSIADGQTGMAYLRTFTTAMQASPNCHGRFIEADDEAYLHDGIPLPTPTSSRPI